jgi:hypothetical protein
MMFLFPLRLTWCCAKHAPLHHPQCPFIQMTDTDVTLLHNYNNMGLARSHVTSSASTVTMSPAGRRLRLL